MVKKSFSDAAPAVARPLAPETTTITSRRAAPSDGASFDAIDPPEAGGPLIIYRLQKRWQFLACAKGRSLARGGVAIQTLYRSDNDPRIGVGFTATRKIGGAVQRNRAKRRMREAARQLLPRHGAPCHDYVFVARGGVIDRDWRRLMDDVQAALVGLAAGGDEPPRRRASEMTACASAPKGPGGSRSKPNPVKPSAPRPPSATTPSR